MKKWKIGYTSGTFDLLHQGHRNIIHRAKEQCDYLIVAVSTDNLCFSYKGIYPYQSLNRRMNEVMALKEVDEVVIQSSMDKMEAYQKYHFNVVFVGDDWKGSQKWNEIEKMFGEENVDIVYFPYTTGISSSLLRKDITRFGLTYKEETKSYCISRYMGDADAIIKIPDTFRDIKITEILPCAFAFHSELQAVYLPDSIQIIGSECFYGCTSLKLIKLTDNIHTIGVGAFAECHQLQEIVLPSGMKTLNSDLFYHCHSLMSVTLPETVEIVRENAMRGAEQLLEEKECLSYFGNWCISCTDDTLRTFKIKDGTIGIADAAFLKHPCLEEIQLPSSLMHIGMFAFDGTPLWEDSGNSEVIFADHWAIGIVQGAEAVNTIILSKDTVGVGDLAFGDCLKLEHLYYQNPTLIFGDRSTFITPEYIPE